MLTSIFTGLSPVQKILRVTKCAATICALHIVDTNRESTVQITNWYPLCGCGFLQIPANICILVCNFSTAICMKMQKWRLEKLQPRGYQSAICTVGQFQYVDQFWWVTYFFGNLCKTLGQHEFLFLLMFWSIKQDAQWLNLFSEQ